jgi:RNA polymerase sigma factor (sigma-70 family)
MATDPASLEARDTSAGDRQLTGVSETTARQNQTQAAGPDAVAEFERLYRSQIKSVTAFFARRSTDPQTVADLTAETFVRVITSFRTFDPRKGTARAWVLGIAQRVFAAHCEAYSRQQAGVQRLVGRRELDADQVGDLIDRIDAERDGRALVSELTSLPALDRAVVELVDIAGLRTKEAAGVLGLSAGATRMRLMRARARLRKATEHKATEHKTAEHKTAEHNRQGTEAQR